MNTKAGFSVAAISFALGGCASNRFSKRSAMMCSRSDVEFSQPYAGCAVTPCGVLQRPSNPALFSCSQ